MHQFCYASKSTLQKQNVLEDLTSLLSEARHLNFKNNLTGVLYYANGYFFQCLEGDLDCLHNLIDKLYLDPRHDQIKLFEIKQIDQRMFPDWSMKYISRNHEVKMFCRDLGFDEFLPHIFEQKHVDALLEHLICSEEVIEH